MFTSRRLSSWIPFLSLLIAVSAWLGTAPASALPPVELYVDPISINEGDGVYNLDVKVKMANGPSGVLASAEFLTFDIDAEAPNDYFAAGGLVTFQPGSTEEIVTLTIVGDTFFEQDESFYFKIFNPTNATIPTELAKITLRNDDLGAGTFNIGDAEVVEGTGGTTTAVFTVELDSPAGTVSGDPLGVQWQTRSFTARGGTDFVHAKGMLFVPGPGTSETLEVQINGDSVPEDTEFFFVDIVYSTGGVIGRATGRGAIIDDDQLTAPLPTLSVDDVSVTEGDSDTTDVELVLRLSEASESAIDVEFRTEADDAEAGVDFQPTEGLVVFEPGQTERTVTVHVIGDTLTEEDETFRLVLAAPSGAELEKSEAVITILDDDAETEPPRQNRNPERNELCGAVCGGRSAAGR